MSSPRSISGGTVHELPEDLYTALINDDAALEAWERLTPLARNEWICWIVSVKQERTRCAHIQRTVEQLKSGKRRPCCFIGCVHRTDKPLSRSQQFILSRRTKH
jgi:hypothetical protein